MNNWVRCSWAANVAIRVDRCIPQITANREYVCLYYMYTICAQHRAHGERYWKTDMMYFFSSSSYVQLPSHTPAECINTLSKELLILPWHDGSNTTAFSIIQYFIGASEWTIAVRLFCEKFFFYYLLDGVRDLSVKSARKVSNAKTKKKQKETLTQLRI